MKNFTKSRQEFVIAVVGGKAMPAAGEYDVPSARADGQVLKVGKRRFRRLRVA